MHINLNEVKYHFKIYVRKSFLIYSMVLYEVIVTIQNALSQEDLAEVGNGNIYFSLLVCHIYIKGFRMIY